MTIFAKSPYITRVPPQGSAAAGSRALEAAGGTYTPGGSGGEMVLYSGGGTSQEPHHLAHGPGRTGYPGEGPAAETSSHHDVTWPSSQSLIYDVTGVCVCVRACVRVYVRVCVRVCVRELIYDETGAVALDMPAQLRVVGQYC